MITWKRKKIKIISLAIIVSTTKVLLKVFVGIVAGLTMKKKTIGKKEIKDERPY